MQKPDGAALLTTRSVVTFWLVLAAAFVVLHLLLAPGRTARFYILTEPQRERQ